MPKKLFLLLIAAIIALTACDDQPSQNDLPTVSGDEPQAVAVNPPRVWIDSPLADTTLIFDGIPLPVIAHASFLAGNAILRVSDANGATLETVDLEQTEQARAGSGLLTRHEGQWLPKPQDPANAAPDGSVIYRLTVELNGLTSEPVILRFYEPTVTPSPSPTLTTTPSNTPSPTNTVTPTATSTSTASPTQTASPSATASPSTTPSPSVTPSPSASATLTPTDTATATVTATPTVTQEGTDTPEIVFVDKLPGVCEFTPIRGIEVAARVGPGESRAARLFLPVGEVYTATGYNDDLGSIWWQSTINNETLWVDSNQVIETGSCSGLVYVTPPPVVYRPPDETEAANDVTAVPGQPVIYYFTATPLNANNCSTLSWSVEFVDAVYLDGQGVAGVDSREVCLPVGTVAQVRTFTLVIYKNNVAVDQRSVTVGGNAPPPLPPPAVNHPPNFVSLAATGCEYTGEEFPSIYFTLSDPDGNPMHVVSAYSSNNSYLRITAISPVDSNGRGSVNFHCIYGGGYGVNIYVTLTVSDYITNVTRTVTILARDGQPVIN